MLKVLGLNIVCSLLFSHVAGILIMKTQIPNRDDLDSSLCLKYGATVYGLILRSVKNPEMAESIFAKVYLEIKNSIPHLSSLDEGVLIKIISIVKQVICQSGKQLACPLAIKLQAESESNIELKRLQAKTILDLIFLDGYTVEQVSEKSGLPTEEIKKSIRQSVMKLKTSHTS